MRNRSLHAWRRRLTLAHAAADWLLAGERVWLAGGYAYEVDRRPGRLVYGVDGRTGVFAVRYRIIGRAAVANTD